MELGVLRNVFKEDKFEEILVANWTHFLDSSKLLAFVLQNVRTNINNLGIIPSAEIKPKGVSITISRCYWTPKGFILWIEFNIPIEIRKMSEGTMELLLSIDGNISYINVLGNLYCA